ELPQALTGTLTGALTWLPPPIEPSPLVCWITDEPEPPPLWTGAPATQPASARPSSATALPQTSIGALTGALTWLPPRIEPSPLVRWTTVGVLLMTAVVQPVAPPLQA